MAQSVSNPIKLLYMEVQLVREDSPPIEELFHLDLKDGVGIWNTIGVSQRTPGKRYGHTLTHSKPFIIVFGGNIGDRAVNDCWILNI